MTYAQRSYEQDIAMQEEIRGRALYSLAIFGKSFITRASGRFVDLRPSKDSDILKGANTTSIDDAVE